MQTKKTVLITGAGFSKNFGGFLASEMWAAIFNNPKVQENDVLRQSLFDNADYESLYEEIFTQLNLVDEEKDQQSRCLLLTESLITAYKKLDDILRQWVYRPDSPYPINHYGLDNFLNQFWNQHKNGKNFIFTLNQDLFLERKYTNGTPFTCPGINYPYKLNEPTHRNSPLANEMFITVPEKISQNERQLIGHSFYIKLHGSFNWMANNQQLVITGQNKLEKIQRIDILDWYWEILKEVLQQGDTKVLLIGYGFKDEHLNRALADAVFQSNLKIYILSPMDYGTFRNIPKDNYCDSALKKGLSGYFQTDLLKLFPSDQSNTQMLKDIETCLFS